jgi:hypothetical protein
MKFPHLPRNGSQPLPGKNAHATAQNQSQHNQLGSKDLAGQDFGNVLARCAVVLAKAARHQPKPFFAFLKAKTCISFSSK